VSAVARVDIVVPTVVEVVELTKNSFGDLK